MELFLGTKLRILCSQGMEEEEEHTKRGVIKNTLMLKDLLWRHSAVRLRRLVRRIESELSLSFSLTHYWSRLIDLLLYHFAFLNPQSQVKALNTNCLVLKQGTVKANEETDLERQLRQQMEKQIQQMNIKERELFLSTH